VERIDFIYDRNDHYHKRLFYLIVKPSQDEKQILVVLKIIDNLLMKEIPQIMNFFVF
jgi:hypothetical protein